MSNDQKLDQLSIELSILPEESNDDDIALANTIGRGIFGDLKAAHYQIEPVDTGTLGVSDFLIQLALLAASGGLIFGSAVVSKLAEEIVAKSIELLKCIFQKPKASKHKDLSFSLTIKFASGYEIELRGSAETLLDNAIHLLKKLEGEKIAAIQNGDLSIDGVKPTNLLLKASSQEE